MADVTLRFTADGSELKSEVASDIKALQGFANAVDVTNKTAVSAFRDSAAAQREQMQLVGASAQEYRKLDSVVKTFERDALAANSAVNLTGRGARTGGRAFATLAFDVDNATTSARGATMAFGNLAYGIASTAKEGSFAAANAGGIFILVTLLGVLAEKAEIAYHALHDLDIGEGKISDAQAAQIKNLQTLDQVEKERIRNQERLAAANADLNGKKHEPPPEGETRAEARFRRQHEAGADLVATEEKIKQILEYNNKLTDQRVTLENALGKKRDEDAKKAAEKVAREMDEAAKLGQKLNEERDATLAKSEGRFAREYEVADKRYQDEAAAIARLGAVQQSVRKRLTEQSVAAHQAELAAIHAEAQAVADKAYAEVAITGGDPVRAHTAKLKLIEIEKDARIKAGWAVATAEEKAEQEVDAIKQSYHDKEIAALGTIGDVMIASNNRAVHAIGEGFVAIRKIVMGYKAAENLIEGMKLTGQGLGLASLGDPGAAAAFAGAAEHFAASAVAAGEALSGAGGSGGRGGSSGGGGSFNPKDSSRLGSGQGASGQALQRLEIVFVNRDQNDKELSRTRQRLDRLNDRNQPIRVAL